MRCDMSVIGGPRCGAPTSTRRTRRRSVRWGCRRGRGCHTALWEIHRRWRGTVWFIEGDITDCFGSLDHSIMRSILAEKICDGRFLRLIDGLLRAGYLEDWRYHETLSGAPQGGILSPLLSNVYLNRLDRYVETTLLPVYN